jgi:DNA-binding winged helix-turn-helix (wHTH) protein
LFNSSHEELTLNTIFRFARFEADRSRYQLRQGSRTVKLERLPLELLFLLLENAGKLVRREQLVAMLWHDASFLDTERGINTAVRKIRKALEDDPRHPQFIETVLGIGYRFIGSVLPENRGQAPLSEIHSYGHAEKGGVHGDSDEIRMRAFQIDASGRVPVLTCHISVHNIPLGRFPLVELELPPDVVFPLQAQDR